MYLGKLPASPTDKRFDAGGTNVAVKIVKLGCTRDAKTSWPETACHDLGAVVEQTNPWRGRFRRVIRKIDGDRISFHRINVEAVPQTPRELAAGDTRANDDAVRIDDVV